VKFKRAEYSAAVSLLQQAVDKAPAAIELRYHLGMALLRNGNAAAAREHLEAALKPGVGFEGAEDARAALNGLSNAG
jgi:Flp pilus assembly protein TadD